MTLEDDTETFRKALRDLGFVPGPITETTRKVYLWKLNKLRKNPLTITAPSLPNVKKIYSDEIEKTIQNDTWFPDLTSYRQLEKQMVSEFSINNTEKWREGFSKCYFTYLLIDSRITNNLPDRADSLSHDKLWKHFLSAIFYIGKGKRARPFDHLMEAIPLYRDGVKFSSITKLQRILDIWNANHGVVCLHIFQNVIPVEAYTREAAMISALGLENVENVRPGDFYGVLRTWNKSQQQKLGVYLLYKALQIFLNEGERQLCPNDIE